MRDYPSSPMSNTSDFGAPPEGCEAQCETLCAGKTTDELNQLADYFRNKADKLREYANETVTMDDFEKAKKDTSKEIPTSDD